MGDCGKCLNIRDLEHGLVGLRNINGATVVSSAYATEHTTLDLDAEYALIEGKGIPALQALDRSGQLQNNGQEAIVTFLDMHHERGRFAYQAAVKGPDIAIGLGVEPNPIEMGLGDRITLSQNLDNNHSSASLGLTSSRWRADAVANGLATGDRAVMLWQHANDSTIRSASFPLSPTRLLVIGKEIDSAYRTQPPHRRRAPSVNHRPRRWRTESLAALQAEPLIESG